MADAVGWLNHLKYAYSCGNCGHEIITADEPKACQCGGEFYLDRCADPLWNVKSDSLGDVRNPVDGKIYDSKSQYHQKIKDAGCHIVEGEPKGHRLDKGDHDVSKELKEAYEQVESRAPRKRKRK